MTEALSMPWLIPARILCSYPLHLLAAAHLMSGPTFPRRRLFWLRAAASGLLLIFVYDAGYTLFPNGTPLPAFLTRAVFLLPNVSIIGMLLLCYRCTPREALYAGTSALALQNLVYNLNRATSAVFGFAEFSPADLIASLGWLSATLAAAYLIYRKWMSDREGHTLPRSRVIQNAVVIAVFVIFLNRRADDSAWAVYIYLSYVLGDILAMGLQITLLHETDLTRRYAVIEQMLAAEQKTQRMTAENVELINRKCHDLKHQIAGLRRMESASERDAYISEIERAVLFYESAAPTGNETLDLILMEKKLYCQEHGIRFTCIVDGAPLAMLGRMDLHSLFGNAIDNAIESVMQEEASKRVIGLRVGTRGAFLSIHIENYVGHPVTLKGGLPVTQKDADYHGFGVLSIRHVVRKYDGTMTIRTDDNLFRLDILIPMSA